VEEPVPPLDIPKTPLTSVAKATRPLNNPPDDDLTTPVPKLDIVVEPLVATVSSEVLLPFLTSRTARVEAAEEVAWIITGMVVEEMEKL
jgi:hypothetical protein